MLPIPTPRYLLTEAGHRAVLRATVTAPFNPAHSVAALMPLASCPNAALHDRERAQAWPEPAPLVRWATGPDGVPVQIDAANIAAHLRVHPERGALLASPQLEDAVRTATTIHGHPTGARTLVYGTPESATGAAVVSLIKRDTQGRRYWLTTFALPPATLAKLQARTGMHLWPPAAQDTR